MIISGSLESPSWFLLAFWPQIFGGGGDLRMVFYHSMKAGSVVGTLSPLNIDISARPSGQVRKATDFLLIQHKILMM